MLRALPWYEGAMARITSLAFSPGPAHHRLLCGVAGGGVYVIPSVRPGRYCSPRHPTHFKPSFLE